MHLQRLVARGYRNLADLDRETPASGVVILGAKAQGKSNLLEAAIALKLIELACLRRARDTEPALLLDDVFAELDGDRQRRLAARLLKSGARQVFITSPRRDELPANLELPVWVVEGEG